MSIPQARKALDCLRWLPVRKWLSMPAYKQQSTPACLASVCICVGLHSLLTNAGGGIKESSIEDGQDIPVHGSLGPPKMGSGEDAADGLLLHSSELDAMPVCVRLPCHPSRWLVLS